MEVDGGREGREGEGVGTGAEEENAKTWGKNGAKGGPWPFEIPFSVPGRERGEGAIHNLSNFIMPL